MTLLSTSAPAHPQYLPLDVLLSATAQRLYAALRSAGEAVRDHRGYHPGTTVVTLFAPVEAVAMAIGVSRRTIYYRLAELVNAGLVDQRAHYCTYRGQTRADGSLWAVRLNPSETNAPVRIGHDYLKGHYRDLGADIAAGRTAWAALKNNVAQSKSMRVSPIDISSILTFSITPLVKSISNDCATDERLELESLLDVPHALNAAVNEMVDTAARSIAGTLGARVASLNFYRWLIWALLRLERTGRGSYWYQVYLMVQRAGVDHREGACRNAGGLFVSRLKASGMWDELRSVAHVRVGRAPSSA